MKKTPVSSNSLGSKHLPSKGVLIAVGILFFVLVYSLIKVNTTAEDVIEQKDTIAYKANIDYIVRNLHVDLDGYYAEYGTYPSDLATLSAWSGINYSYDRPKEITFEYGTTDKGDVYQFGISISRSVSFASEFMLKDSDSDLFLDGGDSTGCSGEEGHFCYDFIYEEDR